MKKLFLMFLATVSLIACDKGEEPNPDSNPKDVRLVKKITSKSEDPYGINESELDFEYDDKMRIAKIRNTFKVLLYGSTSNYYVDDKNFTYKDNTVSIELREVKDDVEQEVTEELHITLNPNGTAKQSITYAYTYDDPEVNVKPNFRMKSSMFDSMTRSASSKTETVTNNKIINDYTYDEQGNLIKVAYREEKSDVVTTHDYIVSWNSGNLSKVETIFPTKHEFKDEFKYSTFENKPCNLSINTITEVWWIDYSFGIVGELGLIGKQSKFLPSSLISYYMGTPSTPYDYTYTFDNNGYIIGIKKTAISPNHSYNQTTTIEYVE